MSGQRIGEVTAVRSGNGWTMHLGDCLDVLPSLAPAPSVLVTDPPYGVALRSTRNGAFGECRIANDGDASVRDAALEVYGDGPALVFGSWKVARPAATKAVLIWEKGEHVGMGDLSLPWKPNTEEIYVLGGGFAGVRTGSVLRHLAIAGTVAVSKGRHHPTEKPVALMMELLAKCPADLVVIDPFAGSGTTGVAAVRSGRRFVGMEVDPTHFATACERLAAEEEQSTIDARKSGQGALFGSGR